MDIIEVVEATFGGTKKTIEDMKEDTDGSQTVSVLQHCLRAVTRIVDNTGGSLGLDPAVYFYTQTGRFNRDIFLAFVSMFAKAERDNNTQYFFKFTKLRRQMEPLLIKQKSLLTQLNIATHSKSRRDMWITLIEKMHARVEQEGTMTEEEIIDAAGFTGKTLSRKNLSSNISDDVKSAVYMMKALESPMLCPVCGGVLSQKSMSYDHKIPKSQQGTGEAANVQLTHSFCNQSVKNQNDQKGAAGTEQSS